MTRIAYIVSHPIQYQAPLLRRIAKEKGIDLRVLFDPPLSRRMGADSLQRIPQWDFDADVAGVQQAFAGCNLHGH